MNTILLQRTSKYIIKFSHIHSINKLCINPLFKVQMNPSKNIIRSFSTTGLFQTDDTNNSPDYWVKKGNEVTFVGALVNLGLSGSKWLAGITLHSPSLVADGIHSLSDLLSDFITLAVVKLSRKPANKLFPYGFGRIESIGAVSISLCLLSAGIYVGYDSLQSLLLLLKGGMDIALNIHDYKSLLIGPGVLVMSLVLKELLFRWTLHVGNKCGSPSLIANAWHHRTDSISAGIALLGVLGRYMGYSWLDPTAGIIVGGFICKIGLEYLINNSIYILDGNDKELYKKIDNLLSISPFVPRFSDLRVRHLGPYIYIDLCIYLPPDTHLEQAIAIEKKINEIMHLSTQNIKEILIHYHIEENKSIHSYDSPFIVPPQEISKHIQDKHKY